MRSHAVAYAGVLLIAGPSSATGDVGFLAAPPSPVGGGAHLEAVPGRRLPAAPPDRTRRLCCPPTPVAATDCDRAYVAWRDSAEEGSCVSTTVDTCPQKCTDLSQAVLQACTGVEFTLLPQPQPDVVVQPAALLGVFGYSGLTLQGPCLDAPNRALEQLPDPSCDDAVNLLIYSTQWLPCGLATGESYEVRSCPQACLSLIDTAYALCSATQLVTVTIFDEDGGAQNKTGLAGGWLRLIRKEVNSACASAVEAGQFQSCSRHYNSQDCEYEYANAKAKGNLSGFCSRCESERGMRPLRSRCHRCCAECNF